MHIHENRNSLEVFLVLGTVCRSMQKHAQANHFAKQSVDKFIVQMDVHEF